MKPRILFLIFTGIVFNLFGKYPENGLITVAQDGSGDYRTISEAVKSIPMFNYERVIILVKSGIYKEKIRLEKDNITIRGENRNNTIIEYSQLRTDWDLHPDAIGPGVINIFANDIILENLTVRNTQSEIGPHAFAVYGKGTRTIFMRCSFISKGGDTVSLWDYINGMYYHSDCYFEGAVDFVCPRGWCYIKNSKFFQIKKSTASVWHAGGDNENQKLVIENSEFDGVDGFELGRHHYEAQFYFLNCRFSNKMSDRQIYRVTYTDPLKNRSFNWGERYYYYNCKSASNYSWIKDNLKLPVKQINLEWIFSNRWNPQKKSSPVISNYRIISDTLILIFSEPVSVMGQPVLKSNSGTIYKYISGGEYHIVRFTANKKIFKNDLKDLQIVNDSKIIATLATISERTVNLKIKDPNNAKNN